MVWVGLGGKNGTTVHIKTVYITVCGKQEYITAPSLEQEMVLCCKIANLLKYTLIQL